jgi:hypothetical protein
MLMKYPVTKDGIDYEVTIEENEYWRDTYDVKLNKIFYSNIFNYKIKRRKTIYSQKYEIKNYDSLNFINLAKDIINKYENMIAENNKRNELISSAVTDFDNWDGKCQ